MAPEDNRQSFGPTPTQEPSAEEVSANLQAAETEPSVPSSIESPPADAGPLPAEEALSFKARIQPLVARLKRSAFFRTRRRTIVTLLVGIPLVLCMSSWLFGFVAFADAASLAELKGMVQTRHEDETQWEPARLNQLLWRKHRVRTGTGSSARLRFFDVSTVDLEEETEVSITQISKRRGGDAIDVVLKLWLGKTAVRAVRFVDPASSFRVDTPTASTVVRGARFTMQVAEDGTTQIDLEEGKAEVKINGEIVVLVMGERITLDPSGLYEIEQVFEPDGQLVADKITAAWHAPGDVFRPELTETEVNQFLAAMSQQPDFFLSDTQIWFVDGEARAATTVVEPIRFDLSAAASFQVVDGKVKPDLRAIAAGVALPVPGPVLNPALDLVLSQLEEYLDQAYSFVEFSDIQIKDGYIVVTGHKQPTAPVDQ
jgi:hypothetical protein